jgi:hypothetical protein
MGREHEPLVLSFGANQKSDSQIARLDDLVDPTAGQVRLQIFCHRSGCHGIEGHVSKYSDRSAIVVVYEFEVKG